MLKLDDLQKQAQQLVRWHREGNYSVGGRIRNLARYRNLTDVEALALKFPLSVAREIVAVEAGFETWASLKSGVSQLVPERVRRRVPKAPQLKGALPVVFVSNVQKTAAFFRDRLGFAIDFLHGNPAFYASVSRGGARLHLRFVHEPIITKKAREREEGLLSALVEVDNIQGLFAEYKARGVKFAQTLKEEAWGSPAFVVVDPDGNWICFAG